MVIQVNSFAIHKVYYPHRNWLSHLRSAGFVAWLCMERRALNEDVNCVRYKQMLDVAKISNLSTIQIKCLKQLKDLVGVKKNRILNTRRWVHVGRFWSTCERLSEAIRVKTEIQLAFQFDNASRIFGVCCVALIELELFDGNRKAASSFVSLNFCYIYFCLRSEAFSLSQPNNHTLWCVRPLQLGWVLSLGKSIQC